MTKRRANSYNLHFLQVIGRVGVINHETVDRFAVEWTPRRPSPRFGYVLRAVGRARYSWWRR